VKQAPDESSPWNSPAIVAFAVLLPLETPIISTELMALVLDFESGRVNDS
jgi:hypothetical protein